MPSTQFISRNRFGLKFLLMIFLCFAPIAGFADHQIPEVVNLIPDEIFIPPGFDNNDHAQVVVSGVFMNSCYKVAPPKSRVDFSRNKIIIENQVYYYPGGWCLQVLVPYSQTIELGVLEASTS